MKLAEKLFSSLKKREFDGESEVYRALDELYLLLDKENIRRTKNIRLIPSEGNRRGGKYSYAEWAHVIGIFQTIMYLQSTKKEGNQILDIGCGTGLLGIACEPLLGDEGKYIGLDVMTKDIEFCKSHYPPDSFEFIHFDVNNPTYAPETDSKKLEWPVKSETVDLAVALSVWTHMSEEDALFYFKEINRVLKKGGKAIITFFVLDDTYQEGLASRSSQQGRFHMLPQNRWVFDIPSYGSKDWFHPKWVKSPEDAIAVTKRGVERLIEMSGLELVDQYQGNWKEVPGVFFQDVLVFQKNN